MYDGVRIVFPRKLRLYKRLLERRGFRIDSKTKEVLYPDGQTTHFFLGSELVKGLGPCVVIRGSLHKFFKGNNDDLFTHPQAKKAIRKLMRQFVIPHRAIITRLEVGFNIEIDNPRAVCNDAIMINGHFRTDLEQYFYGRDWHSAEWSFMEKNGRVNFIIKLYKKTEKIVRFEIKAYHIDSIFPFVNRLIDLKREEVFIACQDAAFRRLKKMDFIPRSFVLSLPDAEMKSTLLLYKDAFTWVGYQDQSRSKKWRERKKLNRILYDRGAKDWREDLLNGMKTTAELMLVNRASVETKNHHKGLLRESVAVTGSDRDATDTANVGEETSSPCIHTANHELRGVVGQCSKTAPLQASSSSTAHTPAADPTARSPPFLDRCN